MTVFAGTSEAKIIWVNLCMYATDKPGCLLKLQFLSSYNFYHNGMWAPPNVVLHPERWKKAFFIPCVGNCSTSTFWKIHQADTPFKNVFHFRVITWIFPRTQCVWHGPGTICFIHDPFPRNCHYEVSQTILYLLTLCYRKLQVQHDIFRLWNYPLHLWSQMKVFPVKTSKISISIYTLRSSCLNKMSRNQASFQEVLLQTTFTSTDPAASRTTSSPSSQDTYNEFWDPKYKK